MVQLPDTVTLVDGRVDLPTRRVQRLGASATLTTLEARLLAYLAARPREVVPRQALLEEVWDYHPDTESRAVDQAVWRLRIKIERDPRQPRHLMTAHGTGYLFEPVRVAAEPSVALADAGPPAAPGPDEREGAFVGREEELDRLASAFDRGVRLVVVVGPGGAGKTRLATELGFRWRGRVVTSDLTDATTRPALVEALARSFDVTLGAEGPRQDKADLVLERALANLGGGLVVLDNLEPRAPSDAVRPLVARWLRAAPEARFLVTTRAELDLGRLRAVEELRLGGLGPTSAATLFRARARAAVRRRLTAIDHDPGAVARLVARVDHLPLAIELAAARAATLTLAEIARGLSGAVAHEPQGPAAPVARHRSVLGTLAWSWDLLAPHERAALAQLAAFRGGADREAADAVIELPPDAPPISAVLDGLALAALVKRRDAGDDPSRFALLESVADFVEPHLDACREAVYARHRRYFLGAGARAAAALRGPRETDAVGWLGREQANLLAAATRARDDAPVDAALLALAVEPVLARQGPYERHREVLDAAVEAAERAAEPRLRAEALLRRGEARRLAGEREAGRADLARARALVPALGDAALEARAVLLEARFRRHDDAPEAARAAFDEALDLAMASGAEVVVADARRDRGTLLLERHAFAEARVEYEAALAAYREAGDGAAAAWTLTRLATVTLELGDYAAAAATFHEALAAHDAMGERRGHAVVLSNLAVLEHEEGRLERAEAYWRAATAIHRTLGDARFVGFGLAGRGWIAVERGELADAVALLDEALGVFREAGDAFFAAVTEARLGVAHRALGHAERAEEAFTRARARFERDGAWALAALGLHEGLAAALARPPGERPAPPPPAPSEASFERAARRLWARVTTSP